MCSFVQQTIRCFHIIYVDGLLIEYCFISFVLNINLYEFIYICNLYYLLIYVCGKYVYDNIEIGKENKQMYRIQIYIYLYVYTHINK